MVIAGCTFDGSGVGGPLPADATVDLTSDLPRPDLPPDLPPAPDADATADLPQPDRGPGCTAGSNRPACNFSGPDDLVGESGLCQDTSFVVSRKCFEDAPCSNGVCWRDTCAACTTDADCGNVCTLLFVKDRGVLQCCAGPSANAAGDFETPCTDGLACRSGLCTDRGFCFAACAKDQHCPGGHCRAATVSIAGQARGTTSCTAAIVPDAGPDAGPDGGPDAPSDSASDLALDLDSAGDAVDLDTVGDAADLDAVGDAADLDAIGDAADDSG